MNYYHNIKVVLKINGKSIKTLFSQTKEPERYLFFFGILDIIFGVELVDDEKAVNQPRPAH